MTRAVSLPTVAQIDDALTVLRSGSDRPVSTSGLAAHLGLSNATFWRHFPAIAQRVSDERRAALRGPKRSVSEAEPRGDAEAKLRRDIAALRGQLDLAVAHIQRLTLENEALRSRAESHSNIIRLDDAR
ncbi:MAG: hypothetical protein CMO30_02175 [Tistrella sp.]|uniref:hypothetical protein n=1 Tax=Microcella indica TaxID=2750620 RepID=UPI000C3D6E08|nr:hypothetical protein [Microcella indica]MBA74085.1 hypothetical protein [Tistrella sp.]MBB03896.1 hypothetical protein [Planctomyces sp.]